MPENPLHQLLNPRSIAVAGASNNPMKMGTLQALSLLKDGWQGAFYPVHPTEKTVLGHRAFAAPAELPEVPDLALIVVPTAQVLPLIEGFAAIGTKRAIVISAGFKEAGEAGRHLEERLREVAASSGMRLLGPNCMGVINTATALNVTVAPLERRPGPLGLASQSGTYVTQTIAYLRERGIRFSKAISVGNEADIDIVDALEYLGEDDQTRAIILYLEGVRHGRRFLEAARRITPRKPVLAQYVGGSAAGARAGLSHTGALAGPDELYAGVFAQAGIIRCGSIEELYAHGWVQATQPPLRGNRLAVVTNSGGPGTAVAHTADRCGMTLPRFSAGLQARIRELIPPHAAAANPVDLTFHLDMEVLSRKIPELILASGEVDGLVLHGAMNSGFLGMLYPHLADLLGGLSREQFLGLMQIDMDGAAALPRKFGLPLILSSFFDRDDSFAACYRRHDVPVFDSPEKAARGMATLLRYKEIREREPCAPPPLPERNPGVTRLIAEARAGVRTALDEHQAKQVLAAYGVPVTREAVAAEEDEAVDWARRIGYPVALKACGGEILHKTDKGLLALNLASAAAVRRAFHAVRTAAGQEIPVLVQAMVAGSREFVAGMTRFPGFGPCVLFGLGGAFTEAYRDTVLRSAPLAAAEAREMLSAIRARDLLGPFRGLAAVDADALAAILQAVGSIALLHPEIAEIDVNPLIVAGAQPVAVDALIVLEGGTGVA